MVIGGDTESLIYYEKNSKRDFLNSFLIQQFSVKIKVMLKK